MKDIITKMDGRAFGRVVRASPLSGGIVNATYEVSTESGTFILQRRPSADGTTVAEYRSLEEHLRTGGAPIPRMVDAWEDEDGSWRIMERVENDQIETPTCLHTLSAAFHLRKTHAALASCNIKPSRPLPGFHDSKAIFRKLGALAPGCRDGLVKEYAERILREESRIFMPYCDPQLIHGDPKWNNFLFSRGGRVLLIDWDTLMIGNPLVDFGDFCRSFCRSGELFDAKRFKAAYLAYALDHVGFAEWEALAATKVITLELAARYLIDWFEDSYFGWNPTRFESRRESNLAAARKYVRYLGTMPEEV